MEIYGDPGSKQDDVFATLFRGTRGSNDLLVLVFEFPLLTRDGVPLFVVVPANGEGEDGARLRAVAAAREKYLESDQAKCA